MGSLLDQLYRTKLQLIAVIAVVVGVAGLVLAHWAPRDPTWAWLAGWPIGEVGSTLFGTGLLAVFFEYVDRKHGDERTDQRVREAIRLEAPAIRDVVLDSLAFDADALQHVASPEMLDRIATNALGLRLGDQTLAAEVYADTRDQVIRAPERWHDVDASVTLAPWGAGPATGTGSMFVATIRWQYRTVLVGSTLRFACVSDLEEHRELSRDPATTSAWYFEPVGELDAGAREAFEVVQVTVDGVERKIRRTQRKTAQVYAASLGDVASDGRAVTVSYTFRALVQRHSHLLYLDLPRPTKGLHVSLAYGNSGVRYVNALDFIASAQQSRVQRTPGSVPTPGIDIGFDGWIFPRSGVAFVWVLDQEVSS